ERLNDPELEDLLVPDYPVLMRRLAGETDYFEAYLRDNVDLVDIRTNPVREFTENGIRYGDQANDLDAVVFATGYDAMSGALQRIDIRGRDGKSLKEHWSREIRTTFGMMCEGFPNMYFLSGPGSPAPLFQPILFCQDQMDWIIKAMNHVADSGALSIEPSAEVEQAWLEECDARFEATLFGTTESWYVGSNVDGKSGRGLIYFGGIVPYREFIHAAESNAYNDFNIV
ncbi:MAG: cyclohexanone monooxygenase, partial [Proteobacteria bacterium]|nr:cyclohexanone monooxygenase [Pseudomonadota bacterium]